MLNILNIAQIIISVVLIVVILMQQRGSGLSGVFGGGGGNAYSSKRGFDKFLFNVTIVFVVLFIGTALFRIIFQL